MSAGPAAHLPGPRLGDPAGLALVRSAGGETVQTTPAYVLDPVALGPWRDAHPPPPGVVLDRLATVPPDELTAAFVDLYVWQHAAGPPRCRCRP